MLLVSAWIWKYSTVPVTRRKVWVVMAATPCATVIHMPVSLTLGLCITNLCFCLWGVCYLSLLEICIMQLCLLVYRDLHALLIRFQTQAVDGSIVSIWHHCLYCQVSVCKHNNTCCMLIGFWLKKKKQKRGFRMWSVTTLLLSCHFPLYLLCMVFTLAYFGNINENENIYLDKGMF